MARRRPRLFDVSEPPYVPLYVIRLGQRSDGVDVAELDYEGRTLRAETAKGAIMALARVTLFAGGQDGPWVAVDSQTGAQRLHGPSLHKLSALTLQEGPEQPLAVRKWRPRTYHEEAA